MKHAIITIVALFMVHATAMAQWVPVSVNTNTWECKPYWSTGTNIWTNLVAQTPAPAGGLTPDATNNVPAFYSDAQMWLSFTDDSVSPYVYDNSGNGNNAEKQPNELRYPVWTTNATEFSEVNENCLTSTNAGIGNSTAEMTISFWLNYTEAQASYDSFLLNGTNTVPYVTGAQLNAGATGIKAFFHNTAAGIYSADAEVVQTFTPGTWYHFAAIYKKNGITGASTAEMRTYINAVEKTSTSNERDFFVTADRQWYVGYGETLTATSSGNGHIDCIIDDVAVIPVALSATSITNMYDGGRSTNVTWNP